MPPRHTHLESITKDNNDLCSLLELPIVNREREFDDFLRSNRLPVVILGAGQASVQV